ncbi:efflux RND transporter periplasmic adaptor subunit [Bacterioplanoides pacificum]|uniref:Efflux RND transporter periplasmic adaptor subunit n=1 Tax=Bacterioplanoides pacificum TaxID=1171596 RepID=A0ABV7VTJ1_9GAMM
MRLFTFAVVLLAIAGCSQPQPETTKDAVRPVKMYQVPQANEVQMRKFPAQVQAAEQSALAFRVAGELLQLPVHAGREVRRGELLARLDPVNYRIAVDDRKARYQLATSQFQRIKDLFAQQQVSQSRFDQVKAELEIAKAALDAARTDLSYTYLKAPFSGVVGEVYVDNHQPVAAGKPVVMLQVRNQLEVRLQVPEYLMANIEAAPEKANGVMYQPEVEFEVLPGKRFRAQYKEHTAQADKGTASYTVTLTLPRPPSLNLLPGMSASVHVDLNQVLSNRHHQILIPASAVFQHEHQAEGSSQASVWVIKADMTISQRSIEVGELTQQGIEVRSGLQPGEQILAAGVHQAREGMRVRPWIQERGL